MHGQDFICDCLDFLKKRLVRKPYCILSQIYLKKFDFQIVC